MTAVNAGRLFKELLDKRTKGTTFFGSKYFFDKFLCASINARKRNLLIFYDSCGKHMFVLQKIISMKINCSFQGERGVREKTSEKYNGRIEYPF